MYRFFPTDTATIASVDEGATPGELVLLVSVRDSGEISGQSELSVVAGNELNDFKLLKFPFVSRLVVRMMVVVDSFIYI